MLGAQERPSRLAVLTSGGDAAGMNPAVRAVVRTALHLDLEVFTVSEGLRGLVEGGDLIRQVGSSDVGGILYRGGTVLGTARSEAFRTRDGRRSAALNLVQRGIDALVVIGGDGSLTGADTFRREWPELLSELVELGEIEPAQAQAHQRLSLVGMVGSIDNDMFGTDMTIGADTALHRITEAIDAIQSTASSHQRTFVVEVMGRNCGYLAVMSALATGANFVLIPESPPETDDWRESLAWAVKGSREIGRRSNIVIVAEGAHDKHGNPITAQQVKEVLEDLRGEDTRVTSLGHVQRGGSPSAFDRFLSTVLGYAAVQQLVADPASEPQMVGIKGNEIVSSNLMDNVAKTKSVASVIAERDYETAMEMRGGSFRDSFHMVRTMVRSRPHTPAPGQRTLRLAVVHGGGPAPGMNTAVRAAVRAGLDMGHTVMGVRRGFRGLARGDVEEMDWMSVSGWVGSGGAELGTSRSVATADMLAEVADQIRAHRIDGLLMVGGWAGYQSVYDMEQLAKVVPGLDVPVVCVPASINNDLPASELSIGTDTALNSIVSDVDKIKQSAVASRRTFIVEVMGHDCGYLALMSGLATGAEHVYLPEGGISLRDLETDLAELKRGFEHGKRLGLVIRSEHADEVYTTAFIKALFEREGEGLFDVRGAILGHVQQGGDPSPFDRIQATRLTWASIEHVVQQALAGDTASSMVGLQGGKVVFTPMAKFPSLVAPDVHRPRQQAWMDLLPVAEVMGGSVH
ncbi:MAG: 6-phosphofructokinase [Acidimicrobiales bacterium]